MSVDGSLSSLSSPLDVSRFSEIHVVSARQVTSCASSYLSYESSDAGSSRSSSRPVRQRVRVSSPRVVRSRVRLCDGRDARTPSPSIGNGHGKSRGLCQGLQYGSGWRRQGGVSLAPDGANDVVPSAMALQGHDLVNQGGERGSAGRLRVLPPEGGVEERGKSIRSVHSLRHMQDADRVREIPKTIGGKKSQREAASAAQETKSGPPCDPPKFTKKDKAAVEAAAQSPQRQNQEMIQTVAQAMSAPTTQLVEVITASAQQSASSSETITQMPTMSMQQQQQASSAQQQASASLNQTLTQQVGQQSEVLQVIRQQEGLDHKEKKGSQ